MRWFRYFDPKHNEGFPADAGDFAPHWARYESLAKLVITLSAGAIAFLINLEANSTLNDFTRKVFNVSPIVVGFFGASIFFLILFLLWMTYCYEEYCHRAEHDSYRNWKFALSISFGWMGFLAFILGFIWLAQNLFGHSTAVVGSQVRLLGAVIAPTGTAETLPSEPTHRWFNFWSWFQREDWSAFGSTLSGLAGILTALSLVILWNQNRHMRSQAEAAQESLVLLKQQYAATSMRDAYDAFNTIKQLRDELASLARQILAANVDAFPRYALFPPNWANVMTALVLRYPEAQHTLQSLGFAVQEVDDKVKRFILENDTHKASKLAGELKSAVTDAINQSNEVVKVIVPQQATSSNS